MTVEFDVTKLNSKERRLYDSMTDSERQAYERIWIQIETAKAKLIQQKNASRLRAARDKKTLADRERRERTHRLIERGAMLEAYLPYSEDMTNDQVKECLKRLLSSDYARRTVDSVRAEMQTNPEGDNGGTN